MEMLMNSLVTDSRKTLFIEAQRLFRNKKHGMDVVAMELLKRLKNFTTEFDKCVLIKPDEDRCIEPSARLQTLMLKSSFYPLWEQWILPRFATLQKNSFLHCTGNTAPVWGNTPLLVTIHDLIFLEHNYLFKKDAGSLYQRFGNLYRSLIVPMVARRARHIITVSEYQRQLIIKKLSIEPANISVVYNGADDRFFEKASPATIVSVCEKYDIDGCPYIFFLANTDPRKNTTVVINAFAMFCKEHPEFNHKLVIKGLSTRQLKKKIMECGAMEFEDRIHWVPYIDYRDLPVLYQGADMLWFPSLSEGFGLPIVEAMAGGTPVITSNVSVMPEIAGDAALYIEPTDPRQLVDQTLYLLTNAPARERLVQRGHEQVKKFTWNSSIEQLLQVYSKVIH